MFNFLNPNLTAEFWLFFVMYVIPDLMSPCPTEGAVERYNGITSQNVQKSTQHL